MTEQLKIGINSLRIQNLRIANHFLIHFKDPSIRLSELLVQLKSRIFQG